MVSYIISFFFNLVEKNLLRVNKFSKCCENGIACLRKGKLRRYVTVDDGGNLCHVSVDPSIY